MSPLDQDTVRREATALRALLETLIPEYVATRAEVTLAPDAPALVRAFWNVIGYSTAFRPFVQSPEEAWGAAELEQILRGWEKPAPVREVGLLDRVRDRLARGVFATAQRAPAPIAASRVDRARLPRKYRFVGVSDLWDHCLVTDEDARADDPPIVRVDRTPFGVRRVHDSYLRRTAHALAQKAFIVSGCGLRFDPPLAGEPVMPTLAPHVARVADGIWRLARPAVPDETEHRGAGEKVGYASFDRLAAWMHDEAPATLTAMSGTTGSFLPLKPELRSTVLHVGRLRRFAHERGGASQIELVGWIEDMAVWITPDPDTEEMHGVSVSAANREGMLAWIERETK